MVAHTDAGSHGFLSAASAKVTLLDVFPDALRRQSLLAESLVNALLPEFEVEHSVGSSFIRELRVRNYVVRREDLDLVEAVSQGVIVAASTHALSHTPSIDTLTGLGAAVFRLAKSIRSKGVFLSATQLAVLTELKLSGGASTTGLAVALQGLTQVEISATLRELSAIALRNGSVVSLASEAADGFWYAFGF